MKSTNFRIQIGDPNLQNPPHLSITEYTCIYVRVFFNSAFITDYRSKNCCLEFPLRKLARECDKLIKQVKQKLIETEIFYDSFSQLVPNAVMADINDLRIKVELVSLKKFIG